MNKRVCFFLQTNNPDIVQEREFYKVDVDILRDLGFEVEFCFSFRRIPGDVDFYFIWWWTYAIFPVMIAHLRKKKSIITGTFNLTPQNTGYNFYSRPFYQKYLIKQSAALADANVMVSQYEYLRMCSEISAHNTYYSPHVLQLEKYYIPGNPLRQNYLFTIAWMERKNALRKCIPEIIQAMHILKTKGIEVPLYIAGKMETDGNFLLELVKDLKLEKTVKFLGVISEEEKIKRLHECAVYLQPTVFEGFGLALVEAMLCRAPAITSSVGAVPEVTGNNCSYVNGKHPEEIAESIAAILKTPEPYAAIAGLGSSYIKENFGYERRKKDIKNILDNFNIL